MSRSGDRRHDSKREHRHKSGHKHKKHRKHKKRSHKSDRSEKGSDSDGDASDDGSPATGTKRSTRSPDGDAPDEPKRMKMSNGDGKGDGDAGSEVAGKGDGEGDGKGDDDEIDELVRRKALIERELQRERDTASKEPKESKPEDPKEQQDSEEATSPKDNVVVTEERTETKDKDKEPKQSKAKDKERTETKTKDKEPNKSQAKDKEPKESKAKDKDKDKEPKKPDASSPSRKSTPGGSRRRSRSPPRRRRSRSRSRSRSPPRRRWSRSPPRRRRSRSPPRRRSRSPPRRRSRSPQRGSRRDDRRDRPALSRHNDTRNATGRDRSSGKAGVPPPPSGRPPSQKAAADDEDDSDIEIEDEDEEAVEAASIEAARKKREEIMAKFKSSAANTPKTPADSAGQGSAIVVPDPVPESGPPSLPGVSPDFGSPRLADTPDNLSPVNLPSSLANKVEEELSMFGDKFDVEASAAASGNAGAINDQCDDAEGYFKIVAGELLDKRYKVSGKSGAGVFSNVVRAIDTLVEGPASKVAIKIIRNNDLMYKAALKELEIIRKLNSVDKDDSHHVVKLKRHFMHKKHLCMVFPSAAMNLRELTKKYGRDGAEVVGLSLTATKAYAKQLLMSLKLLKKTHILHADIKPDNILVNEAKTTVTLCDLGAALDVKEMEVTEYMESRFYRAPEIILGQGFGYGMDMWALGCTLYELYTGKILFTGGNNNQMLKMHLNLKGKPSKQFLKKGSFWTKHFDFDMNFMHRELDTVTQKVRADWVVTPPTPKRGIWAWGTCENRSTGPQLHGDARGGRAHRRRGGLP